MENKSSDTTSRRSSLHNKYDQYLKYYSNGILEDTADRAFFFVEPVAKASGISTEHRDYCRTEINIQNLIKLSPKDIELLKINDLQVKCDDKDYSVNVNRSSISSKQHRDLTSGDNSIGESRLKKWEDSQKLVSIFDPF